MLVIFQQVPPEFFTDVTMGAAFIAACFFMFRYFVNQIDKLQTERLEITEKFIAITEKNNSMAAEFTRAIEHQTHVVETLREDFRNYGNRQHDTISG